MTGVLDWLFSALAAAVAGLVVGAVAVVIVRQFTRHPDRLVVD